MNVIQYKQELLHFCKLPVTVTPVSILSVMNLKKSNNSKALSDKTEVT